MVTAIAGLKVADVLEDFQDKCQTSQRDAPMSRALEHFIEDVIAEDTNKAIAIAIHDPKIIEDLVEEGCLVRHVELVDRQFFGEPSP